MKRLLVNPRFSDRLTALGLTSCDAVVNFFSESTPPPGKESVTVKPRALQLRNHATLHVFYKQYDYPTPSWKFLARRSKARCEYDNYGAFAQLGIACPARIACGEERDALGRLRRTFILTEAVPEAVSLAQFLEQPHTRRTRLELSRQLAAMVRRIHDANFFHHDLVWRNILVTREPSDEPKLWWIDCPRGGFVRWPIGQRRRRLKDLGSLDKSAVKFCSRKERLRFVKLYLNKQRLDAEAKQLVRQTLAYRKRRWPDDWPGNGFGAGVEINPAFRRRLKQAGLDTFEEFMALPAANVVRAVPGRSTIRVQLPDLVGYLKRYEPRYFTPAKKFLRLIHWPGFDDEAAREWRKMQLLYRHGFNTAKPIARGQQGFASFLLQEEIEGGVPADEYLQKLETPRRRQLLAQIGLLVRRLHDAGFIHKDLYLKHIFVVESGATWDLYLIDLQRVLGPRRHRQRWYLKDAAALVFSIRAHVRCPLTDVLRVYKAYAPGKTDKKFVRQVWSRVKRLLKRTPKYKRVWNA